MAGGHHRSGSGVTTPSIDVRIDRSALRRAIADIGERQIPFATALTLNALAKGVKVAEQVEVGRVFDTPNPFTQTAFRTVNATKGNLVSRVLAKDSTNDTGGQNAYLAPYVFGGKRSLGKKKKMLAPITNNIGLNSYGNLPRTKVKTLKAKPGVFVGTIRFNKSGKSYSGVWQRPERGRRKDGSYGTIGDTHNKLDGVRTGLKLLIKFEESTDTHKRLDFEGTARRYIKKNAAHEFDLALRKAMATARK